MKGVFVFLVLLVAIGFGLMGCNDTTDPIVAPVSQLEAISLAKGPVVHSVTGNGNIWLGGKMGVMTIDAHLYADGSVNGVLNLVSTAWNPGAQMHGKVAALTVYETYSFDNGVTGPTALFWWKESVLDGREGKYFASFVVDNGHGNMGAVVDRVGGIAGPYDDVVSLTPQDIATAWPAYFVPLDVGNVTIR